ncbi:MAG: hypothetical protein KDJ63_08300 [Nitratireductor sp.]|nr:hypothetical protein [Nitratireductor sp.]
MQRNTTINLPDSLVQKAKAYAASHGTTMTAIIRTHLEAITESESQPATDPLLAFSNGTLSITDAIRLTGVRDYAELLVKLGQADLPVPLPPEHEIENQAATFIKVWRQT